ncbi:alpha/beta hydrolase [Phytobacter diazotrophicus]|uniref:alpha/beta hydrolase n=1 Tax=Phytobacter diazotrophicus TaxID=395631 RepID=UPI0013EA61B8|nr:alpha/beta hydrolase [Phytobacter diazotrophicus]QIH64992.1 alpha/beta hydrolase [Enterobacteriaceae bacterium A-F18]
MKSTSLILAGCMLLSSAISQAVAAADTLPGSTEGAQIMKFTPSQDQTDLFSNVIYSQVKDGVALRQLRMSLLVPRNNDLKPAIVYFPGGGFMTANHDKYIAMRMALANAGYVVAAAEYRVIPDKFPAPLVDGKTAVRYLRAHAKEYNIDPARIAVLGDSAGGWLAQMLGTTNGEKEYDKGDYPEQSSDVQGVATIYGISNLLNIGEGFPEQIQQVHRSAAVTEALLVHGAAFRTFAGATIDSDPKKALAASPMGHITGHEPPFLIMHGSADTLVSPQQSAQLYQALKAKKETVEYVLVEGAEHGDIHWYQPQVIDHVVGWFKHTLGAPTKQNAPAKADKKSNL